MGLFYSLISRGALFIKIQMKYHFIMFIRDITHLDQVMPAYTDLHDVPEANNEIKNFKYLNSER